MIDILAITYILSQPFRYLLGESEKWSGVNAISSVVLCANNNFDDYTTLALYYIYLTSFLLSVNSRYNLHLIASYVNYMYLDNSSIFMKYYINYILTGSIILEIL